METNQTLTDLILSISDYKTSLSSFLSSSLALSENLTLTSPTTSELQSTELQSTEFFEYSQFTSIESNESVINQTNEIEKQRNLLLKPLLPILNHLQLSVMKSTKLFPPGRLIHIVDKVNWNNENKIEYEFEVIGKDQYSIAYVVDQLYFQEIQLSGNMFSSHLPTEYLLKLRNLFPLSN